MDRIPEQVSSLMALVARYAPVDTHCIYGGDGPTGSITFFTSINKYVVVYRIPDNEKADGYLGCTATSRTPRAGEEWSRGNDLPDGPFSHTTWVRILAAIVSYEMVRVFVDGRPVFANENPPPA